MLLDNFLNDDQISFFKYLSYPDLSSLGRFLPLETEWYILLSETMGIGSNSIFRFYSIGYISQNTIV
jgi:hypothetical protein